MDFLTGLRATFMTVYLSPGGWNQQYIKCFDHDHHAQWTPDKTASAADIDRNGDGIRDDIEAYIESARLAPKQKSAARFMAYQLQQQILTNVSDTAAVR